MRLLNLLKKLSKEELSQEDFEQEHSNLFILLKSIKMSDTLILSFDFPKFFHYGTAFVALGYAKDDESDAINYKSFLDEIKKNPLVKKAKGSSHLSLAHFLKKS